MNNASHAPYSVRLFSPTGKPDGFKIVEKSNWVGRLVMCARVHFQEVRKELMFDKIGVYILRSPPGEEPMIYIGEGDPIRPRLDEHFTKKTFWSSLIAAVSQSETLHKAHVQYLESRLVELAKDANRCEVANGNTPKLPTLSPADVSEAEMFLRELLITLRTMEIPYFEKATASVVGADEQTSSNGLLHINAKNIQARGSEIPDGFVVMKGSGAVEIAVPSIPPAAKAKREQLLTKGILVKQGSQLLFASDHIFSSSGEAANVILGSSVNGRDKWKDVSGKSLKQLEQLD